MFNINFEEKNYEHNVDIWFLSTFFYLYSHVSWTSTRTKNVETIFIVQ